jgi:hypothetical protein
MTMPPLVSISVVVITLSVVAITVALIRALLRIDRATQQFTRLAAELHDWTIGAHQLTRDAHEMIESAKGVITPIRRAAERFEALGLRTTRLSETVLGEVESSMHTAIAAVHGVRAFAANFLQRSSRRFTSGRPATEEGFPHERESAVQR